VGGGTKTRRPITLHMKYNSAAVQPTCFLMTEDSGEQEVSLEELQVRVAMRLDAWPGAGAWPGCVAAPRRCVFCCRCL
jgi:hypothetical protein